REIRGGSGRAGLNSIRKLSATVRSQSRTKTVNPEPASTERRKRPVESVTAPQGVPAAHTCAPLTPRPVTRFRTTPSRSARRTAWACPDPAATTTAARLRTWAAARGRTLVWAPGHGAVTARHRIRRRARDRASRAVAPPAPPTRPRLPAAPLRRARVRTVDTHSATGSAHRRHLLRGTA